MADQNAFSPVDPIKAWKDLQQNWTDALKEMTDRATEMAQSSMTPEGLKQFTDAWVDTQKKFIEQGTMMNKIFPSTELADRFQNAAKMYLETYRWWAEALNSAQGGAPPAGVNEAVTSMWKQAYQNFIEPIVGMPWLTGMPGVPEFQRMVGMPVQAADALMDMQKNWSDMVERATSSAIEGVESSGPEVMREFYASWAKGYEMTVGKLIRVPPIGPAREGIELYQKSLDSYLHLCGAAFDFYLRTTKPSLDAFVSVSNKAQNLMTGDVTPETFQKLYSLTIAEFEKRLHELFSADEFVQTLRTTLEASLSFQKDYQAFLEANLKGTPIVTRTEMDQVHEELYMLRRQIRELGQSVKGIPVKKSS